MRWLKKLVKRLLGKNGTRIVLSAWERFHLWRRNRINPRENQKIVAELVRTHPVLNLELGSGKRPELADWVASDINGFGDIRMDFTKPLPFPDNSVDRIYSSHVLEHFSYPDPMLPFLRECCRILKPGGRFGIAVPDAQIFLNGYHNPDGFDRHTFCKWQVGLHYHSPIDYVNFVAYLGGEHKHMFDHRNLCEILREAGFSDAAQRDFDPEVDLESRRHESVYAMGTKPATDPKLSVNSATDAIS